MLPARVNFASVNSGTSFVCHVKSITQARPFVANKAKDGTLFDRAPVCVSVSACVSVYVSMRVRVRVRVCMSVCVHAH